MRKFFVISAIIFAVLAIIFTVLPLGTIPLLPIGLTLIFALLAIRFSKGEQKKLPKWIIIFSAVILLFVIGKVVFIQDKVQTDKQFEQKKVESKKEDIKDLEGL